MSENLIAFGFIVTLIVCFYFIIRGLESFCFLAAEDMARRIKHRLDP